MPVLIAIVGVNVARLLRLVGEAPLRLGILVYRVVRLLIDGAPLALDRVCTADPSLRVIMLL